MTRVTRNILEVYCMYCGKPFPKARFANRSNGRLKIRQSDAVSCSRKCSSGLQYYRQYGKRQVEVKI